MSNFFSKQTRCNSRIKMDGISFKRVALRTDMATHSRTLAWKIPRTEEPGRLQSMGSQRVGRDWATSLSLSFRMMLTMLPVLESIRNLFTHALHWKVSLNHWPPRKSLNTALRTFFYESGDSVLLPQPSTHLGVYFLQNHGKKIFKFTHQGLSLPFLMRPTPLSPNHPETPHPPPVSLGGSAIPFPLFHSFAPDTPQRQ